MAKKYRITLTAEEREVLGRMIARGKAAARKLAHARVLLQADEGGPARADEDLAAALNVSVRTIERVRQRFVEQGLEAALLPHAREADLCAQARWRAGGPPHRPGLLRAAGGQGALDLAALLAEQMVELQH